MVKVIGLPVQTAPTAGSVTGVTVIVADTGATPLLIALNEGIFPVPAAARPMAGLSLVQLKIVPGTGPVKLIGAVAQPLHTV